MGKKTKKDIYKIKLIGLIIDPISKSPVMILKVIDFLLSTGYGIFQIVHEILHSWKYSMLLIFVEPLL